MEKIELQVRAKALSVSLRVKPRADAPQLSNPASNMAAHRGSL